MIPEEEKTENRRFLEPDYSNEDPQDVGLDDEDDMDISDEALAREAETERLLDLQLELDDELDARRERRLSSRSDSLSSCWKNGDMPAVNTPIPAVPMASNPGPAPWEKAQSASTRPVDRSGYPTYPTEYRFRDDFDTGPTFYQRSQVSTPPPTRQESSPVRMIVEKKAIICDVLDCLYESWESNGKPDIMPRGIFDIKPKFDVWDKLLSLSPEMVYIIFPAPGVIPSFYGQSNITLEYIAQSVGTYLRIPRNRCKVLEQMKDGLPKERLLMGAINDWKRVRDMVYIGVHSGKWGLSSKDIMAARSCKIDYIDVYNLLDGKYEVEQ